MSQNKITIKLCLKKTFLEKQILGQFTMISILWYSILHIVFRETRVYIIIGYSTPNFFFF